IDTNSRLRMSSSVAGHRRAFGTDTVPGTYEDLEAADLVVLVGSNLAWCHPVLYQRIAAAKAARPGLRVIVIDPRRTATCELADLHLPIRPGSDVMLFNGLLAAIEEEGAIDAAYVAAHVRGFLEAIVAARRATTDAVAAETGLSHGAIRSFYRAWLRSERTVTLYSQGVNQSSSGTDKVNAIINCHLATGRIGRPGMGPFSVTGQPNAMGGREVGGLANMLACHMEIENQAHRAAVQAFWQAPAICTEPGLKAVDMFQAVAEGRIKALWIMATNPAVSLPEADAVRAAIAACPFVVVSDVMERTDTTALAHVLLPAAAWGEKSGTVTNSERRISRQRAFLPAPGEARPDWRIIADVAGHMGFGAAFDYAGPADIFREYVALSAVAAGFGLDFDISGLADLTDADYDAMAPVQWPVPRDRPAGGRFFAEGGFFTGDRRARMVAIWPKPLATATGPDYPLRLNTGRVRDHWHTMTRTAKSPRLSQHMAEPYAEIHPQDAERYTIGPADLVTVEGPHGQAIVRALVTERTRPGTIFVPMHWGSEWSAAGRINAAMPAETDPISGQPELKGGVARIARFEAAWYGFAAASGAICPTTAYWALARTATGWRAELAERARPADWEAFARALFAAPEADTVLVEDRARGLARIAVHLQGRVVGVLFASRDPVEVARAHIVAAQAAEVEPADLLAGRPGGNRPDPGATVCSCFDVGVNTILSAIAEQGLASVEGIGKALRAGTNCGSCRPELRALLATAAPSLAAE
ncbi:MAG TPA: molybdopterin-dependent oxidoreductase, partial [Paracoccaceae bacterium]|nr:molybdopterin-dependent oxidoreductase [Paracoccaceae bacterium]